MNDTLRKDIRKDFQFDTDRLFVQKGFATEMIFPLDIGADVVGTFDIACYEPGRLTPRHMEILEELMPAFSLAVYFYLEQKKASKPSFFSFSKVVSRPNLMLN